MHGRKCGENRTPSMQRTARRWMLDREAAKGPIEQPTWKKFKTAEGLPIYLCGATGASADQLRIPA